MKKLKIVLVFISTLFIMSCIKSKTSLGDPNTNDNKNSEENFTSEINKVCEWIKSNNKVNNDGKVDWTVYEQNWAEFHERSNKYIVITGQCVTEKGQSNVKINFGYDSSRAREQEYSGSELGWSERLNIKIDGTSSIQLSTFAHYYVNTCYGHIDSPYYFTSGKIENYYIDYHKPVSSKITISEKNELQISLNIDTNYLDSSGPFEYERDFKCQSYSPDLKAIKKPVHFDLLVRFNIQEKDYGVGKKGEYVSADDNPVKAKLLQFFNEFRSTN